MLAACTGIPSAESQCVRDCCHLEGETPVEIRIAVHRRKPKIDQFQGSMYHEGISKLRDVGPCAEYQDPFLQKYSGMSGILPGEPHMPRLMYTYEDRRDVAEVPRGGTAFDGDSFNPDTFAAPADDSERAFVQSAIDSQLLPSSHIMRVLAGDGQFRQADLDDPYTYTSTPNRGRQNIWLNGSRSVSPSSRTWSSPRRSNLQWTPSSVSSGHPPEPRVPHLREGPIEDECSGHERPCEMLARSDQFIEHRYPSNVGEHLVRNTSGIFTPVTFNGVHVL
jgi:hypothetical protein